VTTTVADTVGAGDSFMAALIWALAVDDDGWDGRPVSAERLQRIGATAARAAAITVSRPGADLPTLSDLTTHRTEG
jgi:fructokinase